MLSQTSTLKTGCILTKRLKRYWKVVELKLQRWFNIVSTLKNYLCPLGRYFKHWILHLNIAAHWTLNKKIHSSKMWTKTCSILKICTCHSQMILDSPVLNSPPVSRPSLSEQAIMWWAIFCALRNWFNMSTWKKMSSGSGSIYAPVLPQNYTFCQS